ncbi:MAG: 2Fe-2S iron-sulfur cluster-binding protein, partial [Dehalococcoidia bacterium]|nr:2Fe-2S iron-sulfur cluster-binding protein [Dehalococcoidia bacterium]
MSAKALLSENAKPSEQEVRVGISGNLCRCTGYVKIVEAILAASQQSYNGELKHHLII